VLVIATSDKGGTGRSVTTCNVAYRRALMGDDVCYLDFDFGSPTAGAIFGIQGLAHGTRESDGLGLHRYFQGKTANPRDVDIWAHSFQRGIVSRPSTAGRLVLYPGDLGGGEFTMKSKEIVQRCVDLLHRLQTEFSVIFVDLSAGRSQAADLMLSVTAGEIPAVLDAPKGTEITLELAEQQRKLGAKLETLEEARWIVFHRWTRQHISAAADLFNNNGLLETGVKLKHDRKKLERQIKFARTAVITSEAEGMTPLMRLSTTQLTWLRQVNQQLNDQANQSRLGRTSSISTIPLEPVLQWREKLITDRDVREGIANQATVEAFKQFAESLVAEASGR